MIWATKDDKKDEVCKASKEGNIRVIAKASTTQMLKDSQKIHAELETVATATTLHDCRHVRRAE